MGRTAGLKEFRMEQAPLAGVRIVAVEQFGAGPFGTLHLADLGADIIRLEDPSTGGDVSRYVTPGQRGTDSLYFDSFNRGKRRSTRRSSASRYPPTDATANGAPSPATTR
jgi:crotonobetainyl-CoA:carnitine CoA-transferase CaiB-like acyl-CoA transferase